MDTRLDADFVSIGNERLGIHQSVTPVRTLERSQGFLRGTYETKESAYSRLDLYTTSGLLPRAHNTKYVNLMCRIHERNRDNLNNSIFSQVAEPHVPKCFPGANNCDVCAKTLHARDVISKSMWKKDQISTKHWEKKTNIHAKMDVCTCVTILPLLAWSRCLALKSAHGPLLEFGGCFLISRGSNIRHYDWIAGGEK